jgi:drug/metabolite transporter (DMT)-like permease
MVKKIGWAQFFYFFYSLDCNRNMQSSFSTFHNVLCFFMRHCTINNACSAIIAPMSSQLSDAKKVAWVSVAPALFVLLWSTGFIGSRYGIPYAEPFTLTAYRMAIVVVLLTIIAVIFRAPWPRGWKNIAHIATAGLCVHAIYLSGVLYAIKWQLPLGFIALIAGLQPLFTALISRSLFHERLRLSQWLGIAAGLIGVLLVVASKYVDGEVNIAALIAAAIAMMGITFGTLYQKRYCQNMDLRTGGVIQFGATGMVVFALSFLFETRIVEWTPEFIFSLFWLAIVLSLGAISLLYLLIRRGAATKVTSLFFLTPAVTAIMAYLLFNESLSLLAIVGLGVSACGVALVSRKPIPTN